MSSTFHLRQLWGVGGQMRQLDKYTPMVYSFNYLRFYMIPPSTEYRRECLQYIYLILHNVFK